MKQVVFENLSVGYDGKAVVSGIRAEVLQGKMTCILGSNGSGKTTLLKTLARIIPQVDGRIELSGKALTSYRSGELAKEMSVVLTEKVELENTTCFEVAAMGRYPHTGFFGVLSQRDREIVDRCLETCSAAYLRDKPFHCLSDGEKQKVLIARGLAQDPELIVLDEPTSHLDIKYKLEVLTTLRTLCARDGKTVICTLHEPDLAVKCCDCLLLVQGSEILAWGMTEDVVESGALDRLYGLREHQFDPLVGSVEFSAPQGKDLFIIGSDKRTVPLFRRLAGNGFGFAAGVLHENDVSCHAARSMGAKVFSEEAYHPITDQTAEAAYQEAKGYRAAAVSDFYRCDITKGNDLLLDRLKKDGIPVLEDWNLQGILKTLKSNYSKPNN